jgi:hypothetical protein
MFIRPIPGPKAAQLPDGRMITRADLPPAGTQRWVARRKAVVVQAVDSGLITEQEAFTLWSLSEEELTSWRQALSRHGVVALRTTALKMYRDAT